MPDKTRKATVEYIFYPGTKKETAERIEELLENADIYFRGKPDLLKNSCRTVMLAVPHADWKYCGHIIAEAFNIVKGNNYKNIVIMGSVHREQEDNIFLPSASAFETPLGSLAVNKELVSALTAGDESFIINDTVHSEEHSIEVILPFIKYLWPDARILPILNGKPTSILVKKITAALSSLFKDYPDDTLFIAGSNFSAYDTGKAVRAEADKFIELLCNKEDWNRILESLNKKEISACGADVILAAMKYLGKAAQVNVLDIDYGPEGNSIKRVCYGAAAFEKGE